MENSSRIYIRGLPPHMTAEAFRTHFSNLAPATDSKFIPHRRIGYVGYRTPEDAARAVKYHNKSFIGMSRIGVEVAQPYRGGESSQAWQKGIGHRNHGKDESRSLGEEVKPSAPSMPPNHDGKDDDDQQPNVTSEREEFQDLPRKRRKTEEPSSERDKGALQESSGSTMNTNQHSTHPEKIEPSRQQSEQLAPNTSNDTDWLRSRTSRVLDLLEQDDLSLLNSSQAGHGSINENKASQEEEEHTTDRIDESAKDDRETSAQEHKANDDVTSRASKTTLQPNRLFLRNLPYTATDDDIQQYFESQGHHGIAEVHLPTKPKSGENKGFAYVEFTNVDVASKALLDLDQKPFQGRLLHIMPAEAKRDSGLDEFAIAKLPLKKQQAIKRKADAAKLTFNWNSMFMNSDAIISSLSSRLGVPKSELLDPSSTDSAVRQAHAETHLIQEAKAYFLANGVNVEAFKSKDRGGTAILVKNFPFGTTSDDLKKLLEAYGSVRRLLVPEAATIAIAEFEEEPQADSAFRGLAYKRLGDSLLFLEKAPKHLFTREETMSLTQDPSNRDVQLKPSHSELLEPTSSSTAGTSTLYIRNLSFATTEGRLRETLRSLNGFVFARVKMKPDPKHPGEYLSMGFGFVEFRSEEEAKAALTAMDGFKLDGHELVMRPSHRTTDPAKDRREADHAKKLAGRKTKIIIKNLPFEATKKDVRSLFGAYGQLRSVRTPRKFDGSTRGFAFADFVTAREAENAMDALKDTHFLGRRLVLEFAAEETSDPEAAIAEMQEKVSRQVDKVALQELTGTGRKKFTVEGADEGL